MNRKQIETIQAGDQGLYEWDPDLAVCETGPVYETIDGPRKGKVFRLVHVKSPTAVISFMVRES